MSRAWLVSILFFSGYLLNGCGGGGATTPPPPVATHLSVTPDSLTATTGTPFNITVSALDASGAVVATYSGIVHFTSSDGSASLPADSTLTKGMGTFSVTLKTAGSQTVTVTDIQTNIVGITGPISVLARAAAKFSVNVPFTATAGTAFTFDIVAQDNSGNTVTDYAGTVNFNSTDGQAVLPPRSALTDGTGSFSATLDTTGNQTITAADSATAAITGTSTAIHVLAVASGFTPTGTMKNARESHTETLLSDGKVLVAGGAQWTEVTGSSCPPMNRFCFVLNALASAEIYNPAAGAFTSTSMPMSVKRAFHTATRLPDRTVLITGGDDRNGTTYATAEIFNPSTGTFTLTNGNMMEARSGHTATLLPNGKVLVTGGANGNSPSAELFDPSTGKFTATRENMIAARFFHTATLLNDGRVLLAGGDSSGATDTAELYDPATDSFIAAGNMTVARTGHRATLLPSGEVLITGGATSAAMPPVPAELFNPATATFVPTKPMRTERKLHTATLLMNGKVLVTGGLDPNGNNLATAELYDPTAKTFAPAGIMETERIEHTATLLLSGSVLITGGINADNFAGLNSLASAETFP